MRLAGNWKRLLGLTILLFCFRVPGLGAELLKWDDPNKPGEVKAFIICAAGPLPAATIRKVTVWTNELDLTYLLKNAPKGRYAIYGMSLGTNNVASEKSKAMVVFWADGKILQEGASTTALSANVVGCDNLSYAHEGKGVLYETGQNPARLYTATACKSIAAGPICKVALHLRKLREPQGQITVFIWSNHKNRPAALLTSGAGTIDAAQVTDGWYQIPISFNALQGETYWVGYTVSKVDPKNSILWVGGGAGARCYSGDGITWVSSANEAMNVRLYH